MHPTSIYLDRLWAFGRGIWNLPNAWRKLHEFFVVGVPSKECACIVLRCGRNLMWFRVVAHIIWFMGCLIYMVILIYDDLYVLWDWHIMYILCLSFLWDADSGFSYELPPAVFLLLLGGGGWEGYWIRKTCGSVLYQSSSKFVKVRQSSSKFVVN